MNADLYYEEIIAEAVFNKIHKWIDNKTNNTTELKKIESPNFLTAKLAPKVYLDNYKKEIVIHNINFDKFIFRIKEMYKYKGIMNLFENKYSTWEINMWYAQKISKSDMKIKEMRVPLFFSLELYKIFQDLYEFYRYSAYKSIANKIYTSTWISNFEKIKPEYTDISKLSNLAFELKPYQVEFIRQYTALKQLYELNGYILSFEQGLGKTLTAIGLAECLNKDQVIVVCPNSLKENWANEIRQYYKYYSDDIKKLYGDIYINNNKLYVSKAPRYIIVNQENIQSIFNIVKPNKNTIIIVDECHNFRNVETERVKALLRLKEITNSTDNLLMSGTPIKATPNELAPALRMIDPYFTESVCERYVKSFNSYSTEISRVVRERFSRIIYKQTKEQVLQLPEKNIYQAFLPIKDERPFWVSTVRKQIKQDFEKEYMILYKELENNRARFEYLVKKYSSANKMFTNEYLEFVAGENVSEVHESIEEKYDSFMKDFVWPNIIKNSPDYKELKMLHARYVYIYNSALGRAIGRNLPPAKEKCYNTILDENIDFFVEKIKSASKKTVIFTPFLGTAKHASEILGKNGINNVLITGGNKDSKTRFDLITEFKESDTIDVLIATIQTLSTGVTLTEANQMIFLGVPYRDADFNQACDRIHRIGQTTDVDIFIILLKSKQENVSTRIEKIMTWSGDAVNDFMNI